MPETVPILWSAEQSCDATARPLGFAPLLVGIAKMKPSSRISLALWGFTEFRTA
jgi:hypothetical protein